MGKSTSRGPARRGFWPLQDAKARFSELIRKARAEGAQHITLHSREEVVVVSAQEYRRLRGLRSSRGVIDAMQASPHRELHIEPERAPMPGRPASL